MQLADERTHWEGDPGIVSLDLEPSRVDLLTRAESPIYGSDFYGRDHWEDPGINLFNATGDTPPDGGKWYQPDPLQACRGICLAVAISLAVWAIGIAWWFA